MNPPSLSIVIPTYRRESVLCDTIESVLTNTDSSVQVIVVDQTPQHEAETVRFLGNAAKLKRFVHHREKIANLPRARNIGILISSGAVVMFLDDDVLIHPDFVKAHLRHYRDERIAGVTGRIVFPGENPNSAPALPWPESAVRNRLDLQIMRYSTAIRNPMHFVGANMSFRRAWLESIGGFSHRFSGTALGEEIELVGRLQRAGGRTLYDPDAWLIHRADQSGGCRSTEPTFARQRGRMKNYYFAMFHGLGVQKASRVAAARWRKTIASERKDVVAVERTSNSRIASFGGRFVGALEGTAMAFACSSETGGLGTLAVKKRVFHRPTLSVAIPTYNRSTEAVRVLESICKAADLINEVIIVDQSDQHSSALNRAVESLSNKMQIRIERQQEPNASRARNRAAALSSCDVILFIDDDTTFDRELILEHLREHSTGHWAIVGGRIVWPDEAPSVSKPFPYSRAAARRRIEAPVCYHTTRLRQPLHLITCNMSVRRDWLVIVGGFNERLPGGGEDLEFVARVRNRGGRVVYTPKAWLFHHSAESGGIRLSLSTPFRFGYKRGVANHYAALRSVGIGGWVATCVRRVGSMLVRAARNQHRVAGRSGPVAEMRESSARGGLAKWTGILVYKGAQVCGSLAAVPMAVCWWIADQGRGGDYRTDSGRRRV